MLGHGLTFHMETSEPSVFLTFDDGPIPELTPWILHQLDVFEAKATFFMVGENVKRQPDLVRLILDKGHSVGNHTYNHLSGFKTKTSAYIENINLCDTELKRYLPSEKRLLFRPPYGRVLPRQAYLLRKQGYKIIMWDVLSKDYDSSIDSGEVVSNVLNNLRPGSIVVMHDNVKASRNLRIALPQILAGIKAMGLRFCAL